MGLWAHLHFQFLPAVFVEAEAKQMLLPYVQVGEISWN